MQVRSVDVQRLATHVATVPADLMGDVADALRLHLHLAC